jgi:hypothetical protein
MTGLVEWELLGHPRFATMMPVRMRLFQLLLPGLWAFAVVTAPAQFSPDDPYYFPGITGNITAENYYGQWHLRNLMPVTTENAGLDANVWGAWQRGLTGAGVVISIIDNGLQGDHPDLAPNFQNDFSWDFALTVAENNQAILRGAPVLTRDNHGTAVGGVAAARGGNGLGVTGAAPWAGLSSQRLLTPTYAGGVSPNQAEAWAIGFQGQKNAQDEFDPTVPFVGSDAPVRVMNHSYGFNEAFILEPDWELLHPALAASAEKKVIHIFSAGNNRGEWMTQDANASVTKTSPNVIVVAALGSDGRYSDYSSFGSNVLVTAPSSSNAPPGLFRISTSDRTGPIGYNSEEDGTDAFFAPDSTGDLANFTSAFGGTSSSAPLVSGIMALGIEANPAMDQRMARHLLARTSRVVDAADPDWITNAAGFDFNKNYGFGLIDADAFTLAASQVQSMSGLVVSAEPQQLLSGQSFGAGNLTLSQKLTVNLADPMPLEYVQVRITLSGLQADRASYNAGVGAILGDISGTLISPSGTSYGLFFNDRNLIGGDFEVFRTVQDSLDWTFLSYAYFGENVNGQWSLSLHNGSTNTNYSNFGSWDSFQLTFGTGSISVIPEPTVGWLIALAVAGLVFKSFAAGDRREW